jgi:RNA polymerase sigma factor (sigma-70 family)
METHHLPVHYTRPVDTQALVDNHRKFLAFVEKRVGDRALAEDILQDAFVKSLEKQDAVRDETSAVAWFYQLLRNSIIDHYRRRETRSKALSALAVELQDAVEPPPEIHDAICGCISEIASTLKPEYAEAIRRVDLDETSVQAFAAEAGITANNAAVRVFRAREALHRQVKAACRTCADHGCVECTCDRTSARAVSTA